MVELAHRVSYVQAHRVDATVRIVTPRPTATATPIPEPAPPGKVSTPNVVAGYRSLTASWSSPSQGGAPITGYRLRYEREGSSGTPTVIEVAGTAVTVFNLLNGYTYTVDVQACNDGSKDRCGAWSTSQEGTPFNAKPTVSGPMSASLAENSTGNVARFTASDSTPGGAIDWNLGGDDSGFFSTSVATDGALTLSISSPLDYENPQDSGRNNTYSVSVFASDRGIPVATSNPLNFVLTITGVNERPVTEIAFSNQTMDEGDVSVIGLSNKFDDPDAGDVLYYAAASSNTGVATASVSGSALTLTASGQGNATITVTAYDRAAGHAGRLSVSQTFSVTVRALPNPPAPANLRVTSASFTSIVLDWDSRPGVTKYRVRYGSVTQETASSSYTATGLSQCQSHTFTVDGYGDGTTYREAWGYDSTITRSTGCPPAPGQVSGLSLIQGDRSLSASWNIPSDGGSPITEYQLEHKRSTQPWDDAVFVSNGTGLSRTISNLTNGTVYDVRVRACNTFRCGDWSGTATGTPHTRPGKVPIPALTEANQQLGVSWTAPPDGGSPITRYDLQHKLTASSWNLAPVVDNGASRTGTIGGLTNGSVYHVRVRACNMVNNIAECGPWSNPATGMPHTTPGIVTNLALTVNDGTLTATWNAPADGGAPITSYNVEYKLAADSSWSSGGTASDTNKQLTGLTNGSAYHVHVQACNKAGCGSWSSVATGTPLATLAAPTDLNVTPLPLRKALLTWTASSNATLTTKYLVQVFDPACPDDRWCTEATAEDASDGHVIDLDGVVNNKGLADEDEFRFRLIAKDVPSSPGIAPQRLDSNPSEKVAIIDNPLLAAGGSVNGHSPDTGEAALKWSHISGASEYTVIYRLLEASTIEPDAECGDLLGDPHSDPGWPSHEDWPYYTLCTDSKSTGEKTVTAPVSTSPVPVQANISPLFKGEIYAIRVNYKTATDAVFSARDAYGWISGDPPGNGRVATFNYFGGHHSTREYKYIICDHTFPTSTRTEWVKVIEGAFKQWQTATDSLITVSRDTADPCSSGPTDPNATDYSQKMREFIIADDEKNEVRMFDLPDDAALYSFPEFKSDVFKICLLKTPELDPPACVTSFHGYSGIGSKNEYDIADRQLIYSLVDLYLQGKISREELFARVGPLLQLDAWFQHREGGNDIQSVDVSFREQAFAGDSVLTPNRQQFNTCFDDQTSHDSADDPDLGYQAYVTALHEAGHALGLSDVNSPLWSQPYSAAHPTIPESVLNHDDEMPDWVPTSYWKTEPDCFPHPFDIMAVYALYQDSPGVR